jgi:hypothetical protein
MRGTLRTFWALGGLALAHGAQAQAQDGDPGPDLDFLEYLGTWQAEDDEWLAIEEWDRDNGDEKPPRADGAQPRSPERRRNHDDENN